MIKRITHSPTKTRFALGLLALTTLTGCASMQGKVEHAQATPAAPKNVILMVGDGMGFGYLKAYRNFKDRADTPEIDLTLFDQLLTGAVSTDAKRATGLVTDSAAAATTYATGYKTKNKAIGVDINDQHLKTVVEYAKENNRRTGLVSTSHINHATPAAFIAHVPSRKQYQTITDHFFDNQYQGKPQVDVILGGGRSFFIREEGKLLDMGAGSTFLLRDNRNLVEEFQTEGYQYLANKSDLKGATQDKLLGLFAPIGLPAAWDRDENTPSLADMTDTALNTLDRSGDGFFLMVEGSQIDWGGHGNDILYILSEMEDFERAIAKVLDFIKANPDTLLIVTADHETGGLSIGANGNYGWDVELLKNIHTTPVTLALKMSGASDTVKAFTELTSIVPTEAEAKTLIENRENKEKLITAIKSIISRASFTGWTSPGHTGVDVPLMVHGAGTENLKGLIDNTDIGKLLIELNRR